MEDSVDLRLDQWRAERPDLPLGAMGIIGRVQRAALIFERELRDHFAAHDLQIGEFDMLATLLRSGPPYRLTAGHLVASSMKTSGAITNRIDHLVAKQLVTRDVDPDNRRRVLIALTETGKELVDRVVDCHVALEERLLEGMEPQARDDLTRLLRTLLITLGDTAPLK